MKNNRLFKASELKKQIKQSEQLFWKHLPDDLELVCNSYWIAIFKKNTDISALLFGIFGRDCENDILRIEYSGKDRKVSVANIDFGRMFPYMDYEVYDTRFSYEHDDRQLRLFKTNKADVVIAIDNRYFKMIANYEKAICEKPSRVVPITFENESEKFLVLPVNLKDFDASVRSLENMLAF